jgi:hypothetical protein
MNNKRERSENRELQIWIRYKVISHDKSLIDWTIT